MQGIFKKYGLQIVSAVGMIIIVGVVLVFSKIDENQYNKACELQNSGYEIYMDGLKNNEISIRRLDPDHYKIRIDKEKKEIIITH